VRKTLVFGRDHLHDPDLAVLDQVLHNRLELAQTVTTQLTSCRDAGYASLRIQLVGQPLRQ
jgi:hypothetical protein